MNENGTLILHANPQLTYTSDQNDYCGQAGLAACSLAVSTVPFDGTPRVLHVLAAFPDTSQPRLKALAWGVAYDATKVVIAAHGPCGTGEFDIPDAGWPGNGTGIGQSWTSTRTSILNEIYWFAAYAYGAADTTSLRLTPHPLQGGVFVDDSAPPVEDSIAAYGWMGFGQGGSAPCPSGAPPEGDGLEGDGEEGGGDQAGGELEGDGGEGLPDEPDGEGEIEGHAEGGGGTPEWPDLPDDPEDDTAELLEDVVLAIDHARIDFGPWRGASHTLQTIPALDPAIRVPLAAGGMVRLVRHFPHFDRSDTLGVDFLGQPVRRPDLSEFYHATFPDAASAQLAAEALESVPGVRHVAQAMAGWVASNPSDPYFYDFPAATAPCDTCAAADSCRAHPQWNLRNPGPGRALVTPTCEPAVAGEDMRLPDDWPDYPDCGWIMVGHTDVGIRDAHPDLNLVEIPPELEPLIQAHPTLEPCGDHGTAMAGLTGARTNAYGMVGVAPGVGILDIEAARLLGSDTVQYCLDHRSEDLKNWSRYASAAIDWYAPAVQSISPMPVLNIERCLQGYAAPDEILALWDGYIQGVVTVAPFGNRRAHQVLPRSPADIPFVLGTGGFTHDGRFWNEWTSCYIKDSTTVLCDATWQNCTGPGPNLDVCAPASPDFVTTSRVYSSSFPDSLYWWTSGQTSGAAAQLAGALAYLYADYLTYVTDFTMGPDDFIGMLTSTARPWEISPLVYSSYTGPVTDDDFGFGKVDVAEAVRLQRSLFDGEGYLYRLCPQTVLWDDPGVVIDSVANVVNDTTFVEYTIQAVRYLPRANPPNQQWYDRQYIAWPIRSHADMGRWTTAPLSYGFPPNIRRKYYLAANASRPTDCHMSPIDQVTGRVVLTGHNFATITSGGGGGESRVYLVDPAAWRMDYTVVTDASSYPGCFGPPPAAVGDPQPASRASIRLSVQPNPVRRVSQVTWSLLERSDVLLRLFDAGGRAVGTLLEDEQEAGSHAVTLNLAEHPGLASGVYWLRLQCGDSQRDTRIVVLRREAP